MDSPAFTQIRRRWPDRYRSSDISRIVFPLLLIALALAATLPLVSSHLGEGDSARYVFGLWRWIHFGPAADGIYDRTLSPGYYAFFAAGLHGLHIPAAGYAAGMTGASVIAFAAMGGLAYGLGRNWLEPLPALAAALLWLFSPGCWWLGIEPHPQAVMTALALAALWLWTRVLRTDAPKKFLLAAAASWLIMAAAMLVRGDALLLLPAYPVTAWQLSQAGGNGHEGFLRWLPRPPAGRARGIWAGSLLIPLLAALAFAAGQRWLLQMPMARAQDSLGAKTLGYIGHGFALMHGVTYFLSQLAPDGMGPGPLATLLALAGIGLLVTRAGSRERKSWLWLLAGWALPGYLFWFLVMGNNPRHVALFFLPLAWAGLRGWQLSLQGWKNASLPRTPGKVPAGLAVLALALIVWGLDFALIPATSDVNWLISPNLPASLARLHARENGLRREARRIGDELSGKTATGTAASGWRFEPAALDPARHRPHPRPPAPAYTRREVALWRRAPAAITPCYLGTPATDPYIESDLARNGFRFARAMPGNQLFTTLLIPGMRGMRAPAMLRIYEVYGRWEYRWILRSARPPCDPVFSTEFGADRYRHYFGRAQWRWLERLRRLP